MNDWLRPPAAAYLHIPFCVHKCYYCDFVSFAGESAARQQAYSLALRREIRQTARWAAHQPDQNGKPFLQPLRTVYFGGGTPTILAAGQLAALLDELASAFGLAADSEITLEANPGTVSAAGLAACRRAGFNRISFGLQAVQPQLLHKLGRLHDASDFLRSLDQAVAAGFTSLSADILFGIPGQSADDVAQTVETLLALPVGHLSFYSLTLEEGTLLQAIAAADPDFTIPDEEERAQYHLIRKFAAGRGFQHYEISSAARPDQVCRHNLTYWKGLPYYGFGVAAHSFVQAVRRGNSTSLDRYLQAYRAAGADAGDTGAFAAASVDEVIDLNAAQKEMLFLGLRLIEGVRHADFAARFGCDLRQRFAEPLARLRLRGLLTDDDAGVRLTEKGLDLANQVFCEFV